MTALEKKQSGEIYDVRDPELRKQYHRAKNLVREYNTLASPVEIGSGVWIGGGAV